MIKKVPFPICGVMLGTAALGNLLQSYSETVRNVCGILAAFLLVLILLKLVKYPSTIKRRFGYSCNGWSSSNFSNGADDT